MLERNKRFSVKTILVAAVSVLLLIAMSIGLVLAMPSRSVNQKAEAATTDFTQATASEQKEIDNNILADWGSPTTGNFIELKSNDTMDFTGDKWYYLTSDVNLNDTRRDYKRNCNVRILLNGYRITGTLVMCIGGTGRASIFDKIPGKSGTGYNYNPNSNGSILTGAFNFIAGGDAAVLNLYGIKILNSLRGPADPTGSSNYLGIFECGWNYGGGTINAYQITVQDCAKNAMLANGTGILNFKYCNIYDNATIDIWLISKEATCKLYKSNVGRIGTGGSSGYAADMYIKDVNFGNVTLTIRHSTSTTFFANISGISGTIELRSTCITNYTASPINYAGNSPNLNFIVRDYLTCILTLSRSARVNTVVVSGTGQIENGATVGKVLHDGTNGRLIDNRQSPAIDKGSAGNSRSKVTVNSGANVNILDIHESNYVGMGAITNPPTTDIGTTAGITVSLSSTSFVYNGQPHTPAVTVKNNGTTLTQNTDYTVSYKNNINASITTRASVTITGKGNYTGSKTVEFTIDRANRPAFNLTELNVDQPGKTLKDFNDRLPSGWSWQSPNLVIDANVTSVVAEYTAADKVNYINTTETVLVRYNGILPNNPEKNIALATIMLENNQTSFTYTGEEFRPAVTVTARDGVVLTQGRDYTVSYMHNQNAGIANILVEAITTTKATNNSYYGKQMVNFEIKRAAVKEAPIQSITITNAGTLLGQCQLPTGWTWENPSLEITANTGVVYAVYTGSDSGNYFNTRARISVVYNVANAGVLTGGNVSSNGAMIVWIVVGVLLFVILIIILLLVLGKRRNKDEEAEEFTKLVALGNVYQARMQQQAMMQQQMANNRMLSMARPRQVVRRVVRRPIEDRSFMLGDGGVNRTSNRDSQQFYLPSGKDNKR